MRGGFYQSAYFMAPMSIGRQFDAVNKYLIFFLNF